MLNYLINERRYVSILAILFAISFFLPMISKTFIYHENHISYSTVKGEEIEKNGVKYKKFIDSIRPYEVAKKDIQSHTDLKLSAIIAISIYFWPVLILLVDAKIKNQIVKTSLKYIEVIFYIASMYVISVFVIMKFFFFQETTWGDLTIHFGGYLTLVFLIGYAISLVYRILIDFYRLYRYVRCNHEKIS